VLMPPLTANSGTLAQMVSILSRSIKSVTDNTSVT